MIRHWAPFISRDSPESTWQCPHNFCEYERKLWGKGQGVFKGTSKNSHQRVHDKIPCSLASGHTLDCPVPYAPIIPDCLVDCMAGMVQFTFDVVQNPCLMNEIWNKSASLSLSLHSADINEVI